MQQDRSGLGRLLYYPTTGRMASNGRVGMASLILSNQASILVILRDYSLRHQGLRVRSYLRSDGSANSD